MPPANGPSATSFIPGPNFKLGAMKKKCGGLQTWAIRYLILDKPNKILYYYHSTKDASPRRALDLNTCTISRLTPEESPKDPGFKVSQPGVRDFIFIGSNAAVVDDWVNAIFQAKAPSQATTQSFIGASPAMAGPRSPMSPVSPMGNQSQSPAKSATASSDNFSYNGPTLAVLPNRGAGMASPPGQTAAPPLMPAAVPPPNRMPGGGPGRPTQVQSARSTQSSVTEASGNNTTLVGNGGGDTNSTLVAGAPAGVSSKVPAGQPVPVLILTPDNKKFAPIERPVVGILKIGRYVNNQPTSDDMITFKSKVISRNHSEIWSVNGEVYIRDTKSQSGTFLNAMRLSEPSKESKPYRLKPGDVIQFGVDYKGATEDNARCISVRVDLKTKVLDPVPSAGGGPTERLTGTEGQDTLVGGGGATEGTLIPGGKTRTNLSNGERTLVGQNNAGESTLYQDKGGPVPMMPGQQEPQYQAYSGSPRPNMIPNRPPMGAVRPAGLSAPGGVVAGPGMRPPMAPGMRPPPAGMQRN